jgi:hypothetical protein
MQLETFETASMGNRFLSAGAGKWAGERMMAALQAGKELTPDVLRTNATLRRDEWKFFDEQIIEEATLRYRAVADLIGAGLTKNIPGAMGKTVYEYETVGDMNPAIVSLDGMVTSENDRVEFGNAGLPIPLTHKDFFVNLRTLAASRSRGEGLDATYARVSTRKVVEETERMLINGGKVFGGLTIYGYLTHPSRNTLGFGTNGNWSQVAKTGENMVADVQSMIAAATADRFYGPYWLYVSSDTAPKLGNDYKAATSTTIRQRILELENISDIRSSDMIPANTNILVQATQDVVMMLIGEDIQTIQWDVQGGFGVQFKVFQIMVPLVRADYSGRSGIVIMA